MSTQSSPQNEDKPIPKVLQESVARWVKVARENLEADGHLQPTAIVGNSQTGKMMMLGLDTSSDMAKDAMAAHLRYVAEETNANYIFTIFDAWILRPDKVHEYDKIISIYGSIGQSPYRVDSVSFMLETKAGQWTGVAQQKKLGLSNKKKTFGEVKFSSMTGSGRFANLLKG